MFVFVHRREPQCAVARVGWRVLQSSKMADGDWRHELSNPGAEGASGPGVERRQITLRLLPEGVVPPCRLMARFVV